MKVTSKNGGANARELLEVLQWQVVQRHAMDLGMPPYENYWLSKNPLEDNNEVANKVEWQNCNK